MKNVKHFIAKNVATLFHDGDVVNLGVGIPTMAVSYLPEDVNVIIHAECGVVGCGDIAPAELANTNIVDAASVPITMEPEGSFMDSAMAFGTARGGHLDMTVLGGFQVDRQGNLANWLRPGQAVAGMGGAMDIVTGVKRVVVAMTHNSKSGEAKIVEKCEYPLTALSVVTDIVTELAMIKICDGQMIVTAMAGDITREELQARTGAKLEFAEPLDIMLD